MKKFTFIKSARGRSQPGGAGTPSICIKLGGVEVGYISFNDAWFSEKVGIRIHIKRICQEEQCGFRWAYFPIAFESADEAKEWLNLKFEKISKMTFLEAKE